MEILGGDPDEDVQDGGRPRKRVAASLDLGTMDLSPESPAAYRRPPAQTGQPAQHPAPHVSPSPTSAPAPAPIAASTAAPPSMADEWAALRRATAAGAGTAAGSPGGSSPGGGSLGDGTPGDGGSRTAARRDTLDAGAPAELNLDEEPPDEPHPTHERDYRAGLVGAVFSSASLALAGILVCVAGLTGGIPLLMLYTELASGPGDSAAKIVAKGLAGIGLAGAVLSFAGLRRMRASTPRWVPTVAGATLLLAIVLLVVAGYFWWTGDHVVPVEDY